MELFFIFRRVRDSVSIDGASRVAQNFHDRSADLSVRALKLLNASRHSGAFRFGRFRAARQAPRTCANKGALFAARYSRRAHQCAELHDRRRKYGRALDVRQLLIAQMPESDTGNVEKSPILYRDLRYPGLLPNALHNSAHRGAGLFLRHRHQRPHIIQIRTPRRALQILPVNSARHHTSNIRIHHRNRPPIGKTGHRPRGVLTNTRQIEQLIHCGGYRTRMLIDDRPRTLVQTERPARVAQTTPCTKNLITSGAGEIGWSGPTVHPFAPRRFDAGDRRLLAHDLAEENSPRGAPGLTPGEMASRQDKPVVEFVDKKRF